MYTKMVYITRQSTPKIYPSNNFWVPYNLQLRVNKQSEDSLMFIQNHNI